MGSTTTQLTDNDYQDIHPQINNSSYVVWEGYDDSDSEIFLYDGSTIIQLTDNGYNDMLPMINNEGYVAWYGNKGGQDEEIFLAIPGPVGNDNPNIFSISIDNP